MFNTFNTEKPRPEQGSALEVLAVFFRLGLTSFGGPVAHLGYFRDELVTRRRWLGEQAYAGLVALCQFLPGPASSQTGIALGIRRAGLPGGLAAWAGFTLPSAALMLLFAYGLDFGGTTGGWLRGLQIVAVAVVALAVWGMARVFSQGRGRASLTLLAAGLTLLWPSGPGQLAVIAGGGLLGWRLFRREAEAAAPQPPEGEPARTVRPGLALGCLAVFGLLLAALPALRQATGHPALAIFDSFYRAGALVFGGGHVVLPLLQAEVVGPGWLTAEQFLAGYGAAQAVPGPLFTFAAYLGAAAAYGPGGVAGGLLALVAIFLPAFLLVIGALPFWERARAWPAARAALAGVNAAVVGLLAAALYHPGWTGAIRGPGDLAFGLAAFGLLAVWKWPPWLVVALAAAAGFGLERL